MFPSRPECLLSLFLSSPRCLREAPLLRGCPGVTFSKNKTGAFTPPAPGEIFYSAHRKKLEQTPHSGTTCKELWESPHSPSSGLLLSVLKNSFLCIKKMPWKSK